jgi:glutaredoxin 3
MADDKQATLYRMVLSDHECPFGRRAKEMLEAAGYDIDEHVLETREDVDGYKDQEGVSTTPQVFIGGERVGGSDALEAYLARQDA